MKILYLHQYFKTPEEGGALRSYHLSHALVQAGHEVELITSHNQKRYQLKIIEGVKVHYLPVNYDNSFGAISRIFSFVKFVIQAHRKAKSISNVQLCYATSTPLTVGIIALRLKRKKGIPYFFEVRDLWPEAPIQMGVIKSSIIKTYLYGLERRIYEGADKLIALSPGIKEGVEKVVTNKPIVVIPNIADCEYFYPQIKAVSIEEKFGVKDKFVLSYIGTLGAANKVESLLAAARECKKEKLTEVLFFIAGKGKELTYLKALANKWGLDNLKFIGHLDREGVRELLNITDAVYISFDSKPVLETTCPNKFFDAIAAGKLCIVNSKGWIKELIEQQYCGFYTDPENPASFVNSLSVFVSNKNKLLEYQQNSRKLAEKAFSKEVLLPQFLQLFK